MFSPNVVKARQMVEAGAIGEVLTMRAREAHSGPHAAHFWDAETAGGGALLDMGCHTVESSRYFFGKDNPVTEVLAWGATMVHGDKTTGEDNAVAMIHFPAALDTSKCPGPRRAAWSSDTSSSGPPDGCSPTRLDTPSGLHQQPVGYLVEKADAETGWVFPVPEEARVYGFSAVPPLRRPLRTGPCRARPSRTATS